VSGPETRARIAERLAEQAAQSETGLVAVDVTRPQRDVAAPKNRKRGPEPLALTPIGALLEEPEETIDWLVDGLIPVGGIVVVAGKPKAGKSTTIRDGALAMTRGGEWLDRRCYGPATVWYLALEGRRRDIRAHFRQMGAMPTDPLHVFVGQAPRDIIVAVDDLAARDRPAAIIVDTLQRFLRAEDTDSYSEMTTLFDLLIGIAQRSGAAIILLHHAGKSDRAGIDAILGSTAIAGSADTIVLLNRTDRYRTISTVQRVGDDLPETVILLDADTGRVRLGGSRKDADRDTLATALLEALQAAGRPVTREEWFETVEGRRQTKLDAFRAATGNRNVILTGSGTRNDPRRYAWTLADSGSAVPSIGREPETKYPPSERFLPETDSYSGSQVPAQEIPVPGCCEGGPTLPKCKLCRRSPTYYQAEVTPC
jgi:hypothetical protein